MSEYVEDLQKLLYKPVRKYIPQEVYFKYKIEYYKYDNVKLCEGTYTIFLIDENELRIWLNDKIRNKEDVVILRIINLRKDNNFDYE